MTVELICVGTELLLGNIVNTNAAFLAEQCAGLGLSCYFQTVVGDNGERLRMVLKQASERSDIVILCGGLGPTEDDLTKETAAELFGRRLVEDSHSRRLIEDFFKNRGIKPTENNWKQALIPEGAIVLDNANGTAPGLILEEKNGKVILLPGPPNELIPMFHESVAPYLKKCAPGVIASRTVKICGIGESSVETTIRDLIDKQTNPTIATYAKTGEVHVRVTAQAESEKAAEKLLRPTVKELKSRFGANIYSAEEDMTLEKAVIGILHAFGMTVTCAESCTGGMVSSRLINVPGASDVYKSGVVTYSNKAKRRLLGVKKITLQKYGAVSPQVAEEMAKGALLLGRADVSLAVTGIAGPDGGTELKPVGLVYIACNVRGNVKVEEYHFNGNRAKIREAASVAALTLLRSHVLACGTAASGGKKKK